MADFVQTSQTKNAVRTLAAPIADVATFDSIVQAVLTNNPFECVDYMSSNESHPGVEKTRERYTVRFSYQGTEAENKGNGSHQFDTVAGYTSGLTAIPGAAAITTAHGGTFTHDPADDSFSATLKCHDANGELYNVVITRDLVSVQSYTDNAILSRVETWADTVAALA
jgi:hypothetical protein